MKRNKELLLKAAQRIEEFPESYSQAVFAGHSKVAPCGTVACLAGEIVICSEPTTVAGIKLLWELDGRDEVGSYAQEVAGLTDEEEYALFYESQYWPEPFGEQFINASSKERPSIAARLLRYLADGGEAPVRDDGWDDEDWS